MCLNFVSCRELETPLIIISSIFSHVSSALFFVFFRGTSGFCLFRGTKSEFSGGLSHLLCHLFLSNCTNCNVYAAYMIILLSRTMRLITGVEGSWEKAQSLPINELVLINPPLATKRGRGWRSVNAASYSLNARAMCCCRNLYIQCH